MLRRESLKAMGSFLALSSLSTSDLFALNENKIMTRTIPSSGEKLPVVGVGTWQTFDVGTSDDARKPLKEVLKTLLEYGGSVVDSSPMYGRSEEVAGDLSEEMGVTQKLFMASKVWTRGREDGIKQMENTFRLMGKKPFDLMQVHNLVDWKTHLNTLRGWKEEGKIKYIGITHYTDSAYNDMAAIMKAEPLDFIQIDYSIDNTTSDKMILPLAREKGIAVLINRPYSGGSIFSKTKGKELPPWAKEFDCNSWGQFFLKFILGNEAVTCVIPGTDNPRHMIDNLGAGLGKLPDASQREKMKKFMKDLG